MMTRESREPTAKPSQKSNIVIGIEIRPEQALRGVKDHPPAELVETLGATTFRFHGILGAGRGDFKGNRIGGKVGGHTGRVDENSWKSKNLEFQ